MSKENEKVEQDQQKPEDKQSSETQEPKTLTRDDLAKMDSGKLLDFAEASLEAKRAANAEAKAANEKVKTFTAAEEKKRQDDLTFKEKFEEEKLAHEATKKTHVQAGLSTQFVSKAVGAGLPQKIANIAAKGVDGLSADNIDAKVKDAIKEFSEFVKKDDDEKKPQTHPNPYLTAQPKPNAVTEKASKRGDLASAWEEVKKKNK